MASEYVVLKRVGGAGGIEDGTVGPERWEVITVDGTVSATAPKAAIKAATDGKPAAERTGTFVATPVRSWQPMTRKVEQAEREVWG